MQDDQLRLSSSWGRSPNDATALAPLISLDRALEQSSLRHGISRDAFLKELLRDLHHQRLVPLLLMLPRRWRLQRAGLPEHLRDLGRLPRRLLDGDLQRAVKRPPHTAHLSPAGPHYELSNRGLQDTERRDER